MEKDTHGEAGEKWTGFDLDGTLAEYMGWEGDIKLTFEDGTLQSLLEV